MLRSLFSLSIALISSFVCITTSAQSKTVAHAFLTQVLGEGKLDQYQSFHTEDFVVKLPGNKTVSLEEDYMAAREIRQSCPGMTIMVEHLLEEGDFVVAHYQVNGLIEKAGIMFPESSVGKKLSIHIITIFKFRNGKICEETSQSNLFAEMFKAGLIPCKN